MCAGKNNNLDFAKSILRLKSLLCYIQDGFKTKENKNTHPRLCHASLFTSRGPTTLRRSQ